MFWLILVAICTSSYEQHHFNDDLKKNTPFHNIDSVKEINSVE
jgi:hypothetical protein